MTTRFNSVNLSSFLSGDGIQTRRYVQVATEPDTNWTTNASLSYSAPTLSITNLSTGAILGLIDGVEPTTGDRILIKDASTASGGTASDDGYNGIWEVSSGTTSSLDLVRAPDLEDGDSVRLVHVWVNTGTHAGTAWVCTSDVNVASNGSNNQTWSRYDLSGNLEVSRGGTGVSSFGGTNTILYTTSADTLDSITSANNSVLVTDVSGVPSLETTLPGGLVVPDVDTLSLTDATASNSLNLVSNDASMSADRTLTVNVNDADRLLDLNGDITTAGNITTAGDFITSGGDSITLNTTGPTNITLPTSGTLATQEYADSVAQGLDVKESVRITTVADTNWINNVSISFTTPTLTISNLPTGTALGLLDGIEPVLGDRILVKDAGLAATGANAIYNGIWEVTGGTTTSLTLERTEDADEDAEVTAGLFTFVEEGVAHADAGFVLSTDGVITVNTTAIQFTQFSGAGSIIAGNGLQKTGNTISADLKANGGIVIETGELAVDLSATNITGTLEVGDGGTGATTLTSNGILFGNGTSAVQSTGSANDSVLVTDASGIPSLATTLPTTVQTNITNLGTVSVGTWEATEIGVVYGGTGLTSVSTNALLYGNGTSALQEVSSANDSVLVTNASGVPSLNTTLPASLTIPSPLITTAVFDSNNNEIIGLGATGSAVNELTISNAATGSAPQLSATGDDTNVSLELATQGTGTVNLAGNSNASGVLRLYENTTNGNNFIGHTADALGSNTTYTWPVAPASNGFVLISNTAGDLTWEDPVNIGAVRDFQVFGGEAETTNSNTSIAFFPWDDGELATSGTRTVRFWHVTNSIPLTVEVFDGTSVLGSATTSASTSGISTFTFSAPGANALLEFRISQANNGGDKPLVYGIFMTIA